MKGGLALRACKVTRGQREGLSTEGIHYLHGPFVKEFRETLEDSGLMHDPELAHSPFLLSKPRTHATLLAPAQALFAGAA